MVSIDFVAGSHGHFLEFVCNKFVAGIDLDFTPFNELGASHNFPLEYHKLKIFHAKHFYEHNLPLFDKTIRIIFDDNDLLVLSSEVFWKAGDAAIQNNDLENNTYYKLKNSSFYSYLIDSINTAYPKNKITAKNPNCPRYILREFFKFGFKSPEINGLTSKLKKLKDYNNNNVVDFSYKTFYNKEMFISSIKNLCDWYGQCFITPKLDLLWDEFYRRQKYRNDKIVCDNIINSVYCNQRIAVPSLSLLQESYINGVLEKTYGVEMPFYQETYFSNTEQIINHLCSK
jgi:hypothetical protein